VTRPWCAADNCHEPPTQQITARVGENGTVTLGACAAHADDVRARILADHIDGQLDLFREDRP
jgi:hypothetical protein